MATIRDRYVLDVDTKGASQGLGQLQSKLSGIGSFVGFAAISAGLVAISRAAISATREMEPIVNQLRQITNGTDELAAAMSMLTTAAQANRSGFADTAELFTKLTLSTEAMGKSQEEVLSVTTKFQQALAISGADAGTAAGAIRQFGQAMASGTVRGDEFNSIVEALGPALSIMARESGISVGQLRKMSQAGELTAETFFNMIEQSTALGAAFAKTTPTITQLEQALGDAFDRALIKVGEVTGVTEIYREAVRRLAREFDQFADTEGALANLGIDELVVGVEKGVIAASTAIQELNDKLRENRIVVGAMTPIVKIADPELEAQIQSAISTLEQLEQKQKEAAEEQEKLNEANAAAIAAVDAVKRSYEQYNDVLVQYARIDPRSEIEKATDAQAQALQVISTLMTAQQQLNLETEQGRAEFAAIGANIELAKTAYFEYGKTIDEILAKTQSLSTFDTFFGDLIEGSREAVTEQTNAMLAVERLTDELAAGRINIDVYADAMDRLNSIMGVTADEADDTAHKFQTYSEFVEAADIAIKESIRTDNFKSRMLAELKRQYEEGGLAIEYYKEALKQLDDTFVEVADSEERYRQFAQKAHTAVRESIDTDIFKERMLAELKEQLESNIITMDEYNRYLKELNGTTKETVDQHAKLKEAIEKTNASTQDRIKAAQDESMLDNLRGIERELKSIELQELRTAAAAKRRIQEQFAGKLSSAELNSALSEIDAATTRSIELQQELAMETYKNQRTFATGWRNAFEEYREAATDNSKLAADVFNRFTRGMEDSIVEFARTGKFSMKDFLADIAEMILRSQVQRLIAQIFGGTNLFGLGGRGNFAGGFANGGTIPAGQFGIVGENGPEFISGPANITPMGGSNMVTYNINAVDAPSFQQLVARDPGFIHAVSEQGRRAIPAGRR